MLKAPFERSDIPHKPGIYIYKNSAGEVIYVGKAVDLFNRVSSYFSGRPHDGKTSHLIQNIASVETIVVESEIEALILEANLIKKHLPLYNIRLTDDKDYLYIVITDEQFPKVLTARKTQLIKVKKWFGPFPSATTVKTTLKKLRRIFPWCSNPPNEVSSIEYGVLRETEKKDPSLRGVLQRRTTRQSRLRPCFYFHIGQCIGPCAGVANEEDYRRIINMLSKFLDGNKDELVEDLTEQMLKASENLQFEDAQRIKRMLGGIEYITSQTKITHYLENPNFLEEENLKAIRQLQQDLNLPALPKRIEAYDISNFQGKESTGSMVVLTHGEIDKSQYRRFKIKITGKPNDVGMHKEMMGRRLNHPEWETPQLILIDGGRGQVRGAYEVLKERGVNIPIFGLAKRMEWLYPPEGEVVKLSKRSLSLRLLQKIRNESHRFAITYHRKLRQKAFGI